VNETALANCGVLEFDQPAIHEEFPHVVYEASLGFRTSRIADRFFSRSVVIWLCSG
jgi:hypothetical protein